MATTRTSYVHYEGQGKARNDLVEDNCEKEGGGGTNKIVQHKCSACKLLWWVKVLGSMNLFVHS